MWKQRGNKHNQFPEPGLQQFGVIFSFHHWISADLCVRDSFPMLLHLTVNQGYFISLVHVEYKLSGDRIAGLWFILLNFRLQQCWRVHQRQGLSMERDGTYGSYWFIIIETSIRNKMSYPRNTYWLYILTSLDTYF